MLSGFYTFYCPILPFIFIHRSFYRKGIDFLFPILESFFVGILELIFGVKFYISGDIIKASESSIILLNHRTRLDWLFFFGALAHRTIPPAHNCKIVLKSMVKEIPGLGWGMQINHYVFLRRNWNTDKDVISKLVKYFKEINLTYQILLFPEGTNLTKSTKRRSDEYGNKNNFPLYDYVLHPRTTGFCFLSQEMMKAQHLDAIYDVTVMYPKTLPETELDLLKGKFPEEVHFFIKRYPIKTIPESESELQRWLRDLWDEKERRLEKAYEVGHFSHSKGVSMKLNASYLSLFFWIPFMIGKVMIKYDSKTSRLFIKIIY
ncbi:UNVERIFIED_CONTAM: hypothetical protein RMT77_018481 [Armadillidium vulgare]